MKTFVPMLSEQIPHQRLNEVVKLPVKPTNLSINVDDDIPLKKNRPTGSPRKLLYICGVEWAWSPAHNRMDHYYLNLKPNQYFLWNHYLDDLSNPWKWEWLFLSYANKCDEDFKKIKTETLVMTGEEDIGSTPEMSKNLSKVIKNSKLKIIPKGKHLCSIECADDVNNAIKEHIKND